MSKTTRNALLGVAAALLLAWGGCSLAYNWGHEGYRDGYVAKMSRMGHLMHSWEGDLLQQGGEPRQGPSNLWQFTVTDAQVVKDLQAVDITVPVRLHYKKYVYRPGYEGETSYRIVRVERLKKQPPQ